MTYERSGSRVCRRDVLKAAGIATAGVAASGLLERLGLGEGLLPSTASPLAPRTALAAGFADVDLGAWYSTEGWIDEVRSSGLMSGYKGTANFGPEDPVSRGQIVTILFRAANPESSATTDPAHYGQVTNFADVPAGEFYTAAVEWARADGIVTGYGGTNNFGPLDNVTREQIAAIAYRYAKIYLGEDMSVPNAQAKSAPDWGAVSDWARDAMAWCYYRGILTGDASTGKLMPARDATRAQIAKIATILALYVRDYYYTEARGTIRVMTAKQIASKLGISGDFGGEEYAILWLDKPQNFYARRKDGQGYVVRRSDRMIVAEPENSPSQLIHDGKKVRVEYGESIAYTDGMAALAPTVAGIIHDVVEV